MMGARLRGGNAAVAAAAAARLRHHATIVVCDWGGPLDDQEPKARPHAGSGAVAPRRRDDAGRGRSGLRAVGGAPGSARIFPRLPRQWLPIDPDRAAWYRADARLPHRV